MKKEEINIRDPFVLVDQGVYYMYGTRGGRCWGTDDGLDCYYSPDLEEWQGPVEVFHRPEGFPADRNYWAPECHYFEGAYYLFASFKSEGRCRGTWVLKASDPLGPFHLLSEDPVTPPDWECLDGTLYVSLEGVPYVVFCHEWVQIADGEVCARRLSMDLSKGEGEPVVLFHGSQAPWSRKHVTKHAERLGTDECFVTDGPFLHRLQDGSLLCLWSGFGEKGYTEAVARSESGDIFGPWIQEEKPLFEENGGHGMLFQTLDGALYLALHYPNTHLEERPVFYRMRELDGMLSRFERD